jgi:hypothetical protein
MKAPAGTTPDSHNPPPIDSLLEALLIDPGDETHNDAEERVTTIFRARRALRLRVAAKFCDAARKSTSTVGIYLTHPAGASWA